VKSFYCSAVIFSVILILSLSSNAAFSIGPIEIFPPGSKPFGLSYEEHAINYWKWQASLPIDRSPYKDNAECGTGQTGLNSSVFYLSGGGGGFHERTCNVPVGKAVLIPLIHINLSDKEVPNTSMEEIDKLVKFDHDHVTTLYLEINGKKIIDEKYDLGIILATDSKAAEYRTHTKIFDIVFPENAIFGVSSGPAKAIADGFYIITKPLEKGTYDVIFKGSIFCRGDTSSIDYELYKRILGDCLQTPFAQDMRYKLIVE
jgi:hypothetical protein